MFLWTYVFLFVWHDGGYHDGDYWEAKSGQQTFLETSAGTRGNHLIAHIPGRGPHLLSCSCQPHAPGLGLRIHLHSLVFPCDMTRKFTCHPYSGRLPCFLRLHADFSQESAWEIVSLGLLLDGGWISCSLHSPPPSLPAWYLVDIKPWFVKNSFWMHRCSVRNASPIVLKCRLINYYSNKSRESLEGLGKHMVAISIMCIQNVLNPCLFN